MIKKGIKSTLLKCILLLKSSAQNNIKTIILLVRRRNNTKGVTLLLPITLIKATVTVIEKYIKIIGKNPYLLATIKSLSSIKINIIIQESNSFFYYQKVTSFID